MRKLLYVLLTCLVVLGCTSYSNAQSTGTSDKEAIKMLKDCYTAYNATWATRKGNTFQKKLDSLQQKYCTDQLKRKLKNMAPDFDLLAYNAYTDVAHLKTLTVIKNPEEEDSYLVSYIQRSSNDAQPTDLKVVLHVNVLDQGNGPRISAVR
jgi:hypothetical protein